MKETDDESLDLHRDGHIYFALELDAGFGGLGEPGWQ